MSNQDKINVCVTSATSLLGMALCKKLLSECDTSKYNIIALHATDEKSLDRAKALTSLGANAVALDEDLGKLKNLLKASESRMVIVPTANVDKIDYMKNCIDCAVNSKVNHVIFLSTVGAHKKDKPWFKEFSHIENYVKERCPSWTVLRPAFLMQNLILYAEDVKSNKILPVATDKPFAPIDIDDVAKAVCAILNNPAPHKGKIYELTGPASLTVYDMAKELSKSLNVEIQGKKISTDEAKKLLQSRNVKSGKIDAFASFYESAESNDLNYVTDDFKKITGHNPTPLNNFLQKHVKTFAVTQEE